MNRLHAALFAPVALERVLPRDRFLRSIEILPPDPPFHAADREPGPVREAARDARLMRQRRRPRLLRRAAERQPERRVHVDPQPRHGDDDLLVRAAAGRVDAHGVDLVREVHARDATALRREARVPRAERLVPSARDPQPGVIVVRHRLHRGVVGPQDFFRAGHEIVAGHHLRDPAADHRGPAGLGEARVEDRAGGGEVLPLGGSIARGIRVVHAHAAVPRRREEQTAVGGEV